MEIIEKDWGEFPKFRHNLWTNYADEPEFTYLTISIGKFKVHKADADDFTKIRSHCTGYHSRREIASRTDISLTRIDEIVDSLKRAEMLRRPCQNFETLAPEEVRAGLLNAVRIWADQLRETHISVEVFNGDVPRRIAMGWLLESYHYIRCFPSALYAAAQAASGRLREILREYAAQERGHELYVEESLLRMGLTREEVRESVPLVSTQLLHFQMQELFRDAPCAALLLAAIVEADDFIDDEADAAQQRFAQHYDTPADSLAPFFEHIRLDANLGHSKLAQNHADLLVFEKSAQLHDTVNRLHDIKHAFDAQKLEIKDYYGKQGNYFPRQRVDFFAI
jgi:hypothetical protein